MSSFARRRSPMHMRPSDDAASGDDQTRLPLSPEEQAHAERQERRAAEAAALRILGGAAQSQSALRRHLVQRGFSEESADSATDEVVRLG
jgi:hypothetical protein